MIEAAKKRNSNMKDFVSPYSVSQFYKLKHHRWKFKNDQLRMTVKKIVGIQVAFIQKCEMYAYTNERSLFPILPLQHLFAFLWHLHMRWIFLYLGLHGWHIFLLKKASFE